MDLPMFETKKQILLFLSKKRKCRQNKVPNRRIRVSGLFCFFVDLKYPDLIQKTNNDVFWNFWCIVFFSRFIRLRRISHFEIFVYYYYYFCACKLNKFFCTFFYVLQHLWTISKKTKIMEIFSQSRHHNSL